MCNGHGVGTLRRQSDRLGPVREVARNMKKVKMTSEQIRRENQLLRTDPHRYLALISARIRDDPRDSQGYFDRHFAWVDLGQPERALEDLETAIQLDPTDKATFFCRGDVLRALGRYQDAIDDFNRAFALDTDNWFNMRQHR